MIGQKFHKLTVLERNGSTTQQKALWLCLCECGNKVSVTTGSLRSGKTKSCGCLRQIRPKELGKAKRIIDYESIECSTCGKNLKDRFLREDGSIIEHLTIDRVPYITCKECMADIARYNWNVKGRENSKIELTETHKQVIIGSILGDGHIETTEVNAGLSIKHGLPQTQYCLWKADLLKLILSKVDHPDGRIRARTIKHHQITELVKPFLDNNGKKIIPKEFDLSPLILGIWYLDDGSLSIPRVDKKGRCRQADIRLSTNSFSNEEDSNLRRLIEKYVQVETSKCHWIRKKKYGSEELYDEPKRYTGIRIYGNDQVKKFINYIDPVIDWQKSGMDYKRL